MYSHPCPIGRENELWSHTLFYDEKCEGCKMVMCIGNRKFCANVPPRCSLHQVIRHQIGCVFCEHDTKNIDCQTCLNCLAEHPDAEPFKMNELNGSREKYLRMLKNESGRK